MRAAFGVGEVSGASGITTVIVSRGMEPMTEACLFHLQRAAAFRREVSRDGVVLVDNASPVPMNRARFEQRGARVARLDTHHGFSAACNVGTREIPNDFYLLLNNDVFLCEEAIGDMLEFMARDATAGICGARMVYRDGTIQHAGMRMGPTSVGPFHVHRGRTSSETTRLDVEFQAVTGACMLIRRTAFDAVSGLDESFPFGWEDVDFCLRARQLGWRVFCAQAHDSLHLESATPGRMDHDSASKELFMKRWGGKWSVDA